MQLVQAFGVLCTEKDFCSVSAGCSKVFTTMLQGVPTFCNPPTEASVLARFDFGRTITVFPFWG